MKKLNKLFFIVCVILLATILRFFMLNWGDVTDDEKHYITESQRLLNNDPYVALRYHPRNHPEPSIGHPLVYQIWQAYIFDVFGLSVYTSRMPNAIAGVLIVIALMLFNKKLGGRVSLTAAFLLAILPMAVRFSRNAQLDTVFTLWITFTALSLWRYLNQKSTYWLLLAGFFIGIAMSTKLNGIYVMLMSLLILAFSRNEQFNVRALKKIFSEIIILSTPAIVVYVLLNDPFAYLDGIINPSFGAYNFFSKQFFTERLPYLFSPRSLFVFIKANFFILSPGFLFAVVFALYFLVTKIHGMSKRFILLWCLPLLHLFIIHGFGMDGVYGWIPLLPPLMLTIALWLDQFKKASRNILLFLIIFSAFPSLFLYGWSIVPVPFDDYPLNHNRNYRQNFYQEIIERVNDITPQNGKVFFLPQQYYPLYALREDISWAYYGDLGSFNVLVVDKLNYISPLKDKALHLENRQGSQDNEELNRFIFIRY